MISTAIPTSLLVPVVYVVEGVGYPCRGSAAMKNDLSNLSHELGDDEGDGFATGTLLTDAVVELVEGGLGLDEALGDELFTHQDATIVDVVDAVACF